MPWESENVPNMLRHMPSIVHYNYNYHCMISLNVKMYCLHTRLIMANLSCISGMMPSIVMWLLLQWQEAFGSEHVLTRKSVKSKLGKTINLYYTNIYNKAHRKKSKHPLKNETVSAISIWKLNHTWRLNCSYVLLLNIFSVITEWGFC